MASQDNTWTLSRVDLIAVAEELKTMRKLPAGPDYSRVMLQLGTLDKQSIACIQRIVRNLNISHMTFVNCSADVKHTGMLSTVIGRWFIENRTNSRSIELVSCAFDQSVLQSLHETCGIQIIVQGSTPLQSLKRGMMPCHTCRKAAGTLVCSQCKSIWYCSANCQAQDWRRHQPTCHVLARESIRVCRAVVPEQRPPDPIPTRSVKGCIPFKVIRPALRDSYRHLVLFAHGSGGSTADIRCTAASLRLPDTLCLLVRGPYIDVPNSGRYYFIDPIHRSKTSRERVRRTCYGLDILLQQCMALGWKEKDIYLVGFGEGGAAMIDFALCLRVPISGVFTLGSSLLLPGVGVDRNVYNDNGTRIRSLFAAHYNKSTSQLAASQAAMLKAALPSVHIDMGIYQLPGPVPPCCGV